MLNTLFQVSLHQSVTEFFCRVLLIRRVLQKMTIHNKMGGFSKKHVVIDKKTTVFNGFFKIDLYKLKHKLFHGGWSEWFTREVFERGDAVVMLPYDPITDQVVLIEQFRVGAIRTEESPWLLEFVAGMFHQGESPVEVAIREAKEEANIDIDIAQVKHVMDFMSSPGGTSEKLYLYVALIASAQIVDGHVAGLDEEHEDIKTHVVSRELALTWLQEGKINNASTIIGLQWLALNYHTLQP